MTLLSGRQKGFHLPEAGMVLHSYPFSVQAEEERAVTAVPVVLVEVTGQAVEPGVVRPSGGE